jgi:hypothetical protein
VKPSLTTRVAPPAGLSNQYISPALIHVTRIGRAAGGVVPSFTHTVDWQLYPSGHAPSLAHEKGVSPSSGAQPSASAGIKSAPSLMLRR